MKRLVLFMIVIFFNGATASELRTSDYLKTQLPEGFWKGNDTESNCSVVIRHDTHVTDDIGIAASVFELSIFSNDRQTKISYKLNDVLIAGGRGDCPVLHSETPENLFVMNYPTVLPPGRLPCFSRYDHTNHGGLQVVVENHVKSFRILNEKGIVIKECKITLNY